MKKILVMLGLASLCFGSFAQDKDEVKAKASLVCKTRIKRKDMQAKVGQVGRIRLSGIQDGSEMEILVSVIDNVISKKEIEYREEESSPVVAEDYNKLVGKFGFKSVFATQALKTSSYFVYLNKKGLSNIEAEVINRQTGERSVLKQCQQSHNFFSRLIKQ